MRVLVIDNYDSFVFNLAQYLGELGAGVEVVRNDARPTAELLEAGFDRLVVSPGPCTPDEAGISLEAIPAFARAGIPVLGVCLGHQAMVQAFGGSVIQAEPVHGKSAMIEHDGRGIFVGLPSPIEVGRYHSLVAGEVPREFEVSARLGEIVMAVRHRELPAEGVQFHPESVLTPLGKQMIATFIGADLPAAPSEHGSADKNERKAGSRVAE